MKEFFITATDTDAGKTFVSCALIQALTKEKKVAAFKPISAGCELIDGALINEDAQLLSEFANCNQTITHINPIAFKEPIAPHIAAKKQNKQISLTQITHHFDKVKSLNADITLVEGAGGWRLPLGQSSTDYLAQGGNETLNNGNKKPGYQFLSDFVKASELQVILIVNMKLGCLNHALLTYETIVADGVDCIAWIANCASGESMSNLSENIAELEMLLPIPKIAQFDYINDVDEEGNDISFNQKINSAAQHINLTPLLV
jgi:dethiobiotin synthetase